MPRKSNSNNVKGTKSKAKCQGSKQAGKGKDKKPSNPWAYKETLPILYEHDKCSVTDLAMLSSRPNFKIKQLSAPYTEKLHDDDLYCIFSGLVNQSEKFMRQWIRCYSLTHEGFIMNLAKIYLKSKNLKIGIWITGIKKGCRPDILTLFLLCVIMGTHCFVHTKLGIWTTLSEEPDNHQALIQRYNLHLGYLGNGIYVEFVPRRKLVSFQIFGVPDPIDVDMDAKPVAIGTLTSDEQETLNQLLSTGITQYSATPSTSAANVPDAKLQTPAPAEVNVIDTGMLQSLDHHIFPPDKGTPVHPAASSQSLDLNLSPKDQGTNPKDLNLDISSSSDKSDEAQPDEAQLNIVLSTPGSEDRSIGAELMHVIIEKHGPELPPKDGNIISNKNQDRRPGTTKKDEIRLIMNCQPSIALKCLTSVEIENATKPSSKKKVIKTIKAEGVYPSARTASKYMFRLSKYGIK